MNRIHKQFRTANFREKHGSVAGAAGTNISFGVLSILGWAICCWLAGASEIKSDKIDSETSSATARSLREWQNSRFGMFVHWGPVSLKGTEIGWSRGKEVSIEEYDNLFRQFNPTNFNADAWVQIAKAAGMKYVVFTAKHHDGFCMWDTKQTDYNIMHTPFGRNVVKELATACRGQGLAMCTYYSTCDWHHPDFPLTSPAGKVRRETHNLDRYEQYLRAQVKELIVNYGPLSVLWFDYPQEFNRARGQGVIDYVRALQPDIIVNNRTGAPGDYDTPEQAIGKYQDDRAWETCMTIGRQWAWKPNDRIKSLKECLQTLIRCAGGDGNLLFNVGPGPDGTIAPEQVMRLKEMGRWLTQYGSTIYSTRGGPWMPGPVVASTRRDRSIFLHIMNSTNRSELVLAPIPRKIVRVEPLTGGKASVTQTDSQVALRLELSQLVSVGQSVTLPESTPRLSYDEIDTIVRLDLDGSAMDIPAR